tara:strand:- start:338 stop:520 length:183 start_codon:yes stop_codon:yes gene_type:complete
VEKNEPPIITKIKKTNDKFVELLLSEKPIFDTLLNNAKINSIKLFSLFKKIKNINKRVKI